MAEEFQIVGYDDCTVAHADEVGSLWSSIKKGVRSVGKVAGKVARNKVFQVAMPAAALSYHTTSKAAGGRGAFKGALGKVVDAGTSIATGKAGGGIASAVKHTTQGAAFVFPTTGLSSIKAVGAANALVRAAANPARSAAALGVIARTRALAARGDASAQRAVSLLANAARAKPAAKPAPKPRPAPKPPVKAAPRPATSSSSAAASSAPVVQGFLIHTAGPMRGRIDFTGGRWRRA